MCSKNKNIYQNQGVLNSEKFKFSSFNKRLFFPTAFFIGSVVLFIARFIVIVVVTFC